MQQKFMADLPEDIDELLIRPQELIDYLDY